jgi:large subunit ribosomal protein L15
MPLQRRLPKVGFTSLAKKYSAEVRLNELILVNTEIVDLDALIAANVIPAFSKTAKIIKSGEINKPVTIKGLKVTIGAKASIEAAGGKIEA